MSAIGSKHFSVQDALDIYYGNSPKDKEEIDNLARTILQSLNTHILSEGPFLTLFNLTLCAQEMIQKNGTEDGIDLTNISLKGESIRALLKKSGPLISINGHPYRI